MGPEVTSQEPVKDQSFLGCAVCSDTPASQVKPLLQTWKETESESLLLTHLNGCCCLVAQLGPTLWTSWTVACQAPLSMGFSRQEYWSGLPFSSPGDRPNPGIESVSLALAGGFFTAEPQGRPS